MKGSNQLRLSKTDMMDAMTTYLNNLLAPSAQPVVCKDVKIMQQGNTRYVIDFVPDPQIEKEKE